MAATSAGLFIIIRRFFARLQRLCRRWAGCLAVKRRLANQETDVTTERVRVVTVRVRQTTRRLSPVGPNERSAFQQENFCTGLHEGLKWRDGFGCQESPYVPTLFV